MSKIMVPRETFEKMAQVIMSQPYAQVAPLVQEMQNGIEEVDGTNGVSNAEPSSPPGNPDGGSDGLHSKS